MAVKRIVDTSFWTDDKILELFSPEDKLFMLYILTNPHTTQLGIYKINKKVMAFELGYSLETIQILLDRFENKYKILIYCTETNEIAIKNYLKYSIIKGGKPVEDCLLKEIKQVKNQKLIDYVFKNISKNNNINETVNKIINIYKNEIYNDNDNEVSYNDTYNDSSKKSKYGTYQRIKLTDKEYQKLVEDFGEDFIKTQIELLDEYVESNNNKNKYTNFNLVLRKSIRDNWFVNNKIRKNPDWFDKEVDKMELSVEEQEEMDKLLEGII